MRVSSVRRSEDQGPTSGFARHLSVPPLDATSHSGKVERDQETNDDEDKNDQISDEAEVELQDGDQDDDDDDGTDKIDPKEKQERTWSFNRSNSLESFGSPGVVLIPFILADAAGTDDGLRELSEEHHFANPIADTMDSFTQSEEIGSSSNSGGNQKDNTDEERDLEKWTSMRMLTTSLLGPHSESLRRPLEAARTIRSMGPSIDSILDTPYRDIAYPNPSSRSSPSSLDDSLEVGRGLGLGLGRGSRRGRGRVTVDGVARGVNMTFEIGTPPSPTPWTQSRVGGITMGDFSSDEGEDENEDDEENWGRSAMAQSSAWGRSEEQQERKTRKVGNNSGRGGKLLCEFSVVGFALQSTSSFVYPRR